MSSETSSTASPHVIADTREGLGQRQLTYFICPAKCKLVCDDIKKNGLKPGRNPFQVIMNDQAYDNWRYRVYAANIHWNVKLKVALSLCDNLYDIMCTLTSELTNMEPPTPSPESLLPKYGSITML